MKSKEVKMDVMEVTEILTLLEKINFHASLQLEMNKHQMITKALDVKWYKDVQGAMRVLIRNNPNNGFIRDQQLRKENNDYPS